MSRRASNRGLSRRSLLRGIGAGSALLSPFASLRSSLADNAAAGGNLLIFFTPNGHKRSLVGPAGNRACFDATSAGGVMTLGESLTPLQPFQSDIAVIKAAAGGFHASTSYFASRTSPGTSSRASIRSTPVRTSDGGPGGGPGCSPASRNR